MGGINSGRKPRNDKPDSHVWVLVSDGVWQCSVCKARCLSAKKPDPEQEIN